MAKESLSEKTTQRITELIDMQYKPGERIPSETELAGFLGVSRTTIREAVKTLCSQNILEIRRGYGTFVCENPGVGDDPLGAKQMDQEKLKEDVFEISQLMEPELVRLAAAKASETSIAGMERILNQEKEKISMYKAGAFIKAEEFRRLDVDFHKAVINGCENQIITKSIPLFLSTCIEWYNVWSRLDLNRTLESFEYYHEKIFDAVARHDPEEAFRFSKEHTLDIIEIYRGVNKL